MGGGRGGGGSGENLFAPYWRDIGNVLRLLRAFNKIHLPNKATKSGKNSYSIERPMDPRQDDDDAPMMRLLHDNDQTDAQLERFIEAAAAKLSRQKARTLANNNVPVQRGVLARRLSYAGSSNPDQERENLEQMEVAVIKKKGWAGAEVKDVKELEEQLDGVIMNSSDIVGDVSSWFDLCYPEV